MHDAMLVRRLGLRSTCTAFIAASLVLSGACDRDNDPSSNTSTASAAGSPLKGTFSEADLVKLQQDDGQWVMPAKNFASTRYSQLDEINSGNASRLKVAWTFSTGVTAGHEAAPLVVGNTMFLVTPFPNYVYALDLAQPGAPMRWKYDPKSAGAARGVACCDVVNRGAAYWNGLIIFNSLDGYLQEVCTVRGPLRRESRIKGQMDREDGTDEA